MGIDWIYFCCWLHLCVHLTDTRGNRPYFPFHTWLQRRLRCSHANTSCGYSDLVCFTEELGRGQQHKDHDRPNNCVRPCNFLASGRLNNRTRCWGINSCDVGSICSFLGDLTGLCKPSQEVVMLLLGCSNVQWSQPGSILCSSDELRKNDFIPDSKKKKKY